MKAPSEKHMEDWIVNNWSLFGEEFLYHNTLGAMLYVPEHELWEWGMEYIKSPGLSEYYDDRRYISKFYKDLIARQFRLPSGRPDLIAGEITDYKPQLCVIELKCGTISYDVIGQCARYVYELGKIFGYVAFYQHYFFNPFDASVDGISIGEQYSPLCGMIVGHRLQDKNIPLVAAQSNIGLVLYDYLEPYYIFDYVYEGGQIEYYRNAPDSPVRNYMHAIIKKHFDKKTAVEVQLHRHIVSRSFSNPIACSSYNSADVYSFLQADR